MMHTCRFTILTICTHTHAPPHDYAGHLDVLSWSCTLSRRKSSAGSLRLRYQDGRRAPSSQRRQNPKCLTSHRRSGAQCPHQQFYGTCRHALFITSWLLRFIWHIDGGVGIEQGSGLIVCGRERDARAAQYSTHLPLSLPSLKGAG